MGFDQAALINLGQFLSQPLEIVASHLQVDVGVLHVGKLVPAQSQLPPCFVPGPDADIDYGDRPMLVNIFQGMLAAVELGFGLFRPAFHLPDGFAALAINQCPKLLVLILLVLPAFSLGFQLLLELGDLHRRSYHAKK